MRAGDTILVTGGSGMLGSALLRRLSAVGHERVLAPSRRELDLEDREAVFAYFGEHQPEHVFHLAALVFGLAGNLSNQLRSADANSRINLNVLLACAHIKTKSVFTAGTVACYPYPYARLPLNEDQLLQGAPHYGEYGYAVSKLLAFHLGEMLRREYGIATVFGLLTNLYGPNDRFDTVGGHVVPSLIAKLYDAKAAGETLSVWGDGSAVRDFLHVDDAAQAILLLMKDPPERPVNISAGQDATIREVVGHLAQVAGFTGSIRFDTSKPTGIPARTVDAGRLFALGFEPEFTLPEGLRNAYNWYATHHAEGTVRI